MKYPKFLKQGDKIVLTALSNGVGSKDEEKINKYLKAVENLEKEGFSLMSSCEFKGYSHDNIRKEVYER